MSEEPKLGRGGDFFLNCFQRNKEKDILALTQQRVKCTPGQKICELKILHSNNSNYSKVGVGFLRLKADYGLFLPLKTELFFVSAYAGIRRSF